MGRNRDVGPMPEVIVCGGIDIEKQDTAGLIARLRKLKFYGNSIARLHGHLCACQAACWTAIAAQSIGKTSTLPRGVPRHRGDARALPRRSQRFTCAGARRLRI